MFIKDIQVFLEFANFYKRFIHYFSKIATSITLILKTISSINNVRTPLKVTGTSIFLILKTKLALS